MSPTTRHRALGILVLIALLARVPVGADTYEVDRTDDSTVGNCNPSIFGDCALRGAIIKANNHAGADTIRLAAHTYTLTVAGTGEDFCQTGDLDVTDTLTIVGMGPELTTIDAAGVDRVLHMRHSGSLLTVRGVTITGGLAEDYGGYSWGGGFLLSQGALRLESCVVTGNAAPSGYGSAIYDGAQDTTLGLRVFDSWITGNTGDTAVVYSSSKLLMRRTTVSGNLGGNAVWIAGDDGTLIDTTVSGNVSTHPDYSGGVAVDGSGAELEACTLAGNSLHQLLTVSGGDPTLRNTVVVGACGPGAPTSLGGNLESPGDTCGFGAFDLVDVPDPLLTDLGWFGGPAPVHRPRAGSATIDQPLASPGCGATDQRRLTRPLDGDGNSQAVCDMGAVELAGPGEIFVETFECGYTTGWSAVVR